MTAVRAFFLFFLLLGVVFGAACREEGDIRIADLSFNGIEQIDAGALRDVLQTKKGSWIPWGRKRFFDRRVFETDLKRIEAFYRDRGFPDARVTSFDVDLNETQDEVSIAVNISEGEPVRVAGIELTGFDVIEEDERRTLQETLPLRAEQPLDRQLLMASRERALNVLRDNGYPYATIAVDEQAAGSRQTRIELRATPGTQARFGPVEIVGEMSVADEVISRQLTFKPGDLFTRREMRESQRRLYGLELFEFVNVESLEDAGLQLPDVPIRVTVAEGKHQKITTGVGYGSEEQARARLRWDHVNFLGNARHAGFEGKWSSLDRGIRADFREPFFLANHFSLNFDGQAWQAEEPVYSLTSLGGRVTMRHQANQQSFWSVSLINEYQSSSIAPEALEDFTLRDELISLGLDPRTGEFAGTLSAVAFDVQRSTANNLLDASSGYVLNAHLEQAGKWLWGSFNYWSASAEARHYLPVARRFVAANRVRLAGIDALGDLGVNVPFYKRYFLGGSSSIRGWGRLEVGPTSGFGLPIGGHTMFDGSSEVRVPLFGKFAAVAFLDYGNVWSNSWEIDLADLRYAVGPGLRYLTPIGPARVDFGYQLTPIDGLRVNGEPEPRHWRIHFSVGQAF